MLPMLLRRRRFDSQVARFGRHRLHYREYGAGPPLLLIHGLVGSARWWRYNVPALSPHFRVYVIELVGFGSNRAWRPARIDASADLLAQFIATLPEGRADVVGHSMGGQIATHLAASHPERVRRLVLAGASGLLNSDIVRMSLRLPGAVRYVRPGFLPTLAFDSLRSGPINLLMSAVDILANDVTAALRRIAAPALLIWGRNDTIVPLSVAEAVHEQLVDSRIAVIERAGHVMMWDRPREFNRLVLDFLRETMDDGRRTTEDS
jgi:pimeloyl-ACP methyl ester carboxylesterase